MYSKFSSSTMDQSSRGIGTHNIGQLIKQLNKTPDVEHLKLYRNNINNSDLGILVPALKQLPKLRILDLGYNEIGDEGIKALDSLVEGKNLQQLILTMNTGITNQSSELIQGWRERGITVNTYHTSMSLAPSLPSTIEKKDSVSVVL